MPTYADYHNARTISNGATSDAPIKLIVDHNDEVVEVVQGMEIDSSVQVVQDIRNRRTSSDGEHDKHEIDLGTNLSMQDVPKEAILLVVDTNWLLSHLDIFEKIEDLVPRNPATLYAPLIFLLPNRVLRELDGLKNGSGQLGMLARHAASFILDKLSERPDLFRGQRIAESTMSRIEARIVDSDDAIMDCCLYFASVKGIQVGILSDDRVLCSKVASQGLHFITYDVAFSDPSYFLTKIHPDLPPYILSLRAHVLQAHEDTSMSSIKPPRDLPSIEVNYPLHPPELLELIQRTISVILASHIFGTLLKNLANGNREMFEYILQRHSVFRSSRNRAVNATDYNNWTGSICLMLLEDNWSLFEGRASRKIPFPEDNDGQDSRQTDVLSSPARTNNASPSSSRWASPSPSTSRWASNSSRSRSRSNTLSEGTPSSSSTAYQSSKLSPLASALATDAQQLSRWSITRWKVIVEDLEALLLGTALLDTDERQWLLPHVRNWKANIEFWKANKA